MSLRLSLLFFICFLNVEFAHADFLNIKNDGLSTSWKATSWKAGPMMKVAGMQSSGKKASGKPASAQKQPSLTKQQATARAKGSYPGNKILSVNLTRGSGPPVYRIKMLSKHGVVKYVFVDGHSGAVFQ